jgi:hypothetical protein
MEFLTIVGEQEQKCPLSLVCLTRELLNIILIMSCCYKLEKDKNLKNRLPVIVQAGTYSGVTSIALGTTGWWREDKRKESLRDSIRFYKVRKGG